MSFPIPVRYELTEELNNTRVVYNNGDSLEMIPNETCISIGEMIIGGSVVWNQLIPIWTRNLSKTENGVTLTDNRDGTYTVVTDAGGATERAFISFSVGRIITANHKYLYYTSRSDNGNANFSSYMVASGIIGTQHDRGNGVIFAGLADGPANCVVALVPAGAIFTTPYTIKPQLFDLTIMFGDTIADAIYAMEQAEAGAGVALFRKLFASDFYEYNAGTNKTIALIPQ